MHDMPHEPGQPSIRDTTGDKTPSHGRNRRGHHRRDATVSGGLRRAEMARVAITPTGLTPRLVGAGNGELKLTELKWKTLEGFSGGRIDKNYQGQPLKVGGKTYPGGIGVHAPTVIAYDLPEGYVRFQAIGGLDNSGSDQGGCGEQASIQFSVYTEKPVEGPISTGNDLLTKVLGKDGPLSVSDADLEQFLTGR